jgi:hypothetical protein
VLDKRTFIARECPLLPEHVVRRRKDALFSLAAVCVGLLASYGPAFYIRPFHVGIHTGKHKHFITDTNPEWTKYILDAFNLGVKRSERKSYMVRMHKIHTLKLVCTCTTLDDFDDQKIHTIRAYVIAGVM